MNKKVKWALEEISGLHDNNITDFLTKEPVIKTDEEFKWDINNMENFFENKIKEFTKKIFAQKSTANIKSVTLSKATAISLIGEYWKWMNDEEFENAYSRISDKMIGDTFVLRKTGLYNEDDKKIL